MLSKNFQKEIPLHQWTFPINKSIKMPRSFDYAVKADKYVTLPAGDIFNKSKVWLEKWIDMITGD